MSAPTCEAQELRRVCAWCEPGTTGENTTHGICEPHKNSLLLELHAMQREKAGRPISPKETP